MLTDRSGFYSRVFGNIQSLYKDAFFFRRVSLLAPRSLFQIKNNLLLSVCLRLRI